MSSSDKLQVRALAGRVLPAIGLGCMGMSEFYGATDEETSLRALRFAFDSGYRHFDTADMYGRGENEALVGRFLRSLTPAQRREAFVATKIGITRSGAVVTEIGLSNDPAYLQSACEGSLRRLGLETIDLLYLHRKDPQAPIEETMEVLHRLQRQGKVRAIGLSEVNAETLERAHSVAPVAALQSELSIWTRDAEARILPLCERLGIAFVAFSPLGRGLAAGRLDEDSLKKGGDIRSSLPRFQGENLAANLLLVRELEAVAAEQGCSTAQLSLAWVLSRSPVVHAIPGSRRERFLRENFEAQAIPLAESAKARIDRIFSDGRVQGLRYSQSLLKTTAK